ncbi:MAG: hypothetical protein ABIH46_12355 [Chloroflexota bacterium]
MCRVEKRGKTEWVTLSSQELDEMIDSEAREKLNMSGEELRKLWRSHRLPDSAGTADVVTLLRLAE